MEPAKAAIHEALKREWTDQYVQVKPDSPELKRFAGIVGRVVAVNFSNKALVDFQDGGWYDISASPEYLTKLDPGEAKTKFDPKVNSAQAIPEKQG
jgi:hypothetical protein